MRKPGSEISAIASCHQWRRYGRPRRTDFNASLQLISIRLRQAEILLTGQGG